MLTGLHFARRAGDEVGQAVHDRPRGRVQRTVDLGSFLRRSWTAPRLAPSPPRAAARGWSKPPARRATPPRVALRHRPAPRRRSCGGWRRRKLRLGAVAPQPAPRPTACGAYLLYRHVEFAHDLQRIPQRKDHALHNGAGHVWDGVPGGKPDEGAAGPRIKVGRALPAQVRQE